MVKLRVGANDAGQTLEKYLKKMMPKVGLSELYKLVRTKQVRIDGRRTNDSKLVLQGGEEVVVFVDTIVGRQTGATPSGSSLQDAAPVKIVHEDETMLIVDKPKGLPVHDETGADNLDYRVLSYLTRKGVFDPSAGSSFIPAHVHRIDAPTGGIVVYAKTRSRLVELNELIRDHEVFQKFYLATVEGKFDGPLTVSGYTMKDYSHGNLMSFFSEPKDGAQLATTKFEIISYDPLTDTTRLQVRLLTGRKHQIRSTLAFLGHPVVGDERYGAKAGGELMLLSYRVVIKGKEYRL